ncbi:MAG: hypothetical protein OXG44_12705 [Gammaproteobacteria bacterium]|nr:hypothetical protein [Gammaproteobacteria bacterium]
MSENPSVEVVENSSGRIYVIGGTGYPSVTSVLGEAFPKGFLVSWHGRMAAGRAVDRFEDLRRMIAMGQWDEAKQWLAEAADDYRDEKADRGARVHLLVEDWFSGRIDQVLNDPEIDPAEGTEWERLGPPTVEECKLADKTVQWLERDDVTVVDMEKACWHDGGANESMGSSAYPGPWGGRADLWIETTNPKLCAEFGTAAPARLLCDIKTGNSLSVPSAVQLHAYNLCDESESEFWPPRHDAVRFHGGLILHVGVRGVRPRPVIWTEELDLAWRGCLLMRRLAREEFAERDPIGRKVEM